ncbi:hypothetical protein GSI_09108 [Ganoderma sinense ZZ0214-1]|uniref:Uncharacterized protein n=1 Tax=Ganoderma sinense ZZ0214-1 TaxID=1077348 RepID=A0A2G8S5K8_9APHY|nr:hypothetical protein GSI_09108 [Ganoderma sinense ZZ0214-1]
MADCVHGDVEIPGDLHLTVTVPTASDSPLRHQIQNKTTWNYTLPVNNLPVEILASIFFHVQQIDFILRRILMDIPQFHPSSESGIDKLPPSWTGVMLVCRHWREVALASRKLWCTFNPNFRSKAEWIHLCLARSAPATLYVDCEAIGAHHPLHDRLFPHVHRIRRLHYGTLSTKSVHPALALLGEGMPALEVLNFQFDLRHHRLGELTADRLHDLVLTHHRFPRLFDLVLVGIAAPSDFALFANLRRLCLRHCAAKFSLRHFLEALDATGALEILELSGFLQHLCDDRQITPIAHRQPLRLSRLTRLLITKHSPSLTSHFLSHLIIPSTALLYVYSLLADVREDEVQETIAAIVPPKPAASLPVLAQVADVEVTVHDRTYGLRGGRRTGVESYGIYSLLHLSNPYVTPPKIPESHLVTLSICSPAFGVWERSLPKALDDLLHVFASATLTTLKVVAHCQQADAPTWERVFLHLPHLASLALLVPLFSDVYGEYACTGTLGEADTVFDGLLAASRARSSSATADPPNSESSPQTVTACPCLKAVSVKMDGLVSPELLESMVECFRFRAGQGARLERLAIEQRSGVALAPALRRAYVSQLLEVVGELSFCMVVDGRWRDYADASDPSPGFYVSDDSVSDEFDKESNGDDSESM